jgi:hypothetical protein
MIDRRIHTLQEVYQFKCTSWILHYNNIFVACFFHLTYENNEMVVYEISSISSRS